MDVALHDAQESVASGKVSLGGPPHTAREHKAGGGQASLLSQNANLPEMNAVLQFVGVKCEVGS